MSFRHVEFILMKKTADLKYLIIKHCSFLIYLARNFRINSSNSVRLLMQVKLPQTSNTANIPFFNMEWIGNRNADQSSTTATTPSTAESLVEPGKAKIVHFSNEILHDDLKDTLRLLYRHSKDGKYPSLARFIQEATLVVRHEVRLLPTTLRTLVPPIETVFDLYNHEELRNGPLGGTIEAVLLCASQLATFIGQVSISLLGQLNLTHFAFQVPREWF